MLQDHKRIAPERKGIVYKSSNLIWWVYFADKIESMHISVLQRVNRFASWYTKLGFRGHQKARPRWRTAVRGLLHHQIDGRAHPYLLRLDCCVQFWRLWIPIVEIRVQSEDVHDSLIRRHSTLRWTMCLFGLCVGRIPWTVSNCAEVSGQVTVMRRIPKYSHFDIPDSIPPDKPRPCIWCESPDD